MPLIQTAASGNWNTGGTWVGGSPPGVADTWEILNTHTVTIAAELTNNPLGGTIRSGGQLTIAFQMTTSYVNGNIVVDSGGKIYASRGVSNKFRVNGAITSNGVVGIDYGTSGDRISNTAVGAVIEIICSADQEANKGLINGIDGGICFYGATLLEVTTLAVQANIGDTTIVLTDDMALRPGTVAEALDGTADMICIGQPPTLGAGVGAFAYGVDTHRVVAYVPGTKTVTLGDFGDWGHSYKIRGGTPPNYNDIDLQRPVGTPVYRMSRNVVLRGSAPNRRPKYAIDAGVGEYSYSAVYTMFPNDYYAMYCGKGCTLDHISFIGNNYGLYTLKDATYGALMAIAAGSPFCGLGGSCQIQTLYAVGDNYGCGVSSCIHISAKGVIRGCTTGITGSALFIDSGGDVEICGNGTGMSGGGTGNRPAQRLVSVGNLLIHGNPTGLLGIDATLGGTAVFSNNTLDFAGCRLYGRGAQFTTFAEYTGEYLFNDVVSESIDHNGVVGDYAGWTTGGTIADDPTLPIAGQIPYQHVCSRALNPCYRQISAYVSPHTWLYVEGWLRQNAVIGANRPRLQIVDPLDDPLLGGTVLAEIQMADIANVWEHIACSWFNTGDLPRAILVRATVQDATATAWEWFKITPCLQVSS